MSKWVQRPDLSHNNCFTKQLLKYKMYYPNIKQAKDRAWSGAEEEEGGERERKRENEHHEESFKNALKL